MWVTTQAHQINPGGSPGYEAFFKCGAAYFDLGQWRPSSFRNPPSNNDQDSVTQSRAMLTQTVSKRAPFITGFSPSRRPGR